MTVGTSGSVGLRFTLPTPSARSLPARMCGMLDVTEPNAILVWPPTTSISAGPRHDQQRVAVLWRVGDEFAADDATGATAVLNDDLPAQPVAEMLADHAADDVVDAAGRKRNDQPHRPVRIVLRRGHSRKRQ